MRIPKISELVYHFKLKCKSRGWEASQHEDWVKVDNKYHNFLWMRTVHPTTFKAIVEEHKCAIRQGVSYRVVNVDYTAWLFSETPPEELLQMTWENPKVLKKIAIYDLSWINSEKPVCLKVNQTDSRVFEEFENFLEKNWRVKIKPVEVLLSQQA